MVFLGTACGGDWEFPVFHMTYWDGERIRGFIPFYGNIWSKRSKSAFAGDLSESPSDFFELERLERFLGFKIDVDTDQCGGRTLNQNSNTNAIIEALYNENLIFKEIEYVFKKDEKSEKI